MSIEVAKSAGFCFGVDRAVQNGLSTTGRRKKKVYTLGPIIHNPQMIAELEARGVEIIETVEHAPKRRNHSDSCSWCALRKQWTALRISMRFVPMQRVRL